MATETKTIGVTGRDYSTITAFEAAITNTTFTSAGTDVIGDIYDDGDFDEAPEFSWSASNVDSVTIKSATGEGHTGVSNSGARLLRSVDTAAMFHITSANTVWNHMEGDYNNKRCNGTGMIAGAPATGVSFRRLLAHHQLSTIAQTVVGVSQSAAASTWNVLNCVLYDVETTNNGSAVYGAAMTSGSSENVTFANCVLHKFVTTTGTANAFNVTDNSGKTIQNCIATDADTQDYSDTNYTAATSENNIASDTSASGTSPTDSVAASSLYVSLVDGSEDFHLLGTASDAIDTGKNLVTTPTGVNFSLDGRDRDAEGDTWDRGADEFVSAGGGRTTRNRGANFPGMFHGTRFHQRITG